MTDQLLAWLCLKSAPGLKHRDALELLARYPDPLAFVGQAAHPLHSDQDISPAIREHLRSATPHPRLQQIAKLCEHYQIEAFFYGGEDYPLGLANILAPPLILWCRGQLETALKQVCLAVVGTRKPTAYGRASCTKLLGPVCQQGATIVSGPVTRWTRRRPRKPLTRDTTSSTTVATNARSPPIEVQPYSNTARPMSPRVPSGAGASM